MMAVSLDLPVEGLTRIARNQRAENLSDESARDTRLRLVELKVKSMKMQWELMGKQLEVILRVMEGIAKRMQTAATRDR